MLNVFADTTYVYHPLLPGRELTVYCSIAGVSDKDA